MEKGRLKGVLFIGGIYILFGILYFLIGAKFRIAKTEEFIINYPRLMLKYIWPGISIVVGLGLILYKKWARMLAIVLSVLKAISEIWNTYTLVLYYGAGANIKYLLGKGSVYFSALLISFVFIYYLTRPKIKKQFK